MKRILSCLVLISLMLSLNGYSFAQETSDGLQFRIEKDGSVTITGYIGTSDKVIIPKDIDNQPVSTIGNGAFMQNERITNVEIPEGVMSLGNGAFSGCVGLTSIIIPSTVQFIGESAFNGCNALKSLELPDGIKEIPTNMLAITYNLMEVVLPSSVEVIGDFAFYGSGIQSINLYEGLHKIGMNAFAHCDELESIVIPNSVKEIGPNAFWNCDKLVSATLPIGIKTILSTTFSQDISIEKVAIPKSVKSISMSAFQDCYKVNIWGFKGSEAEKFANKNNISFVTVEPVKEVKILSNGVDVTKSSLYIDLNTSISSMQIASQTFPENPWLGVTWKSSNTKSVSIDNNGLVIGLKQGKATITATAVDGSGKKATCEVVVANLAKQIQITGENAVKAGKKLKLTATVLPDTTSNKKLEWTTSDKSIATVDAAGSVTAKKVSEENSVIITAKSKDGSGVLAEYVITVTP